MSWCAGAVAGVCFPENPRPKLGQAAGRRQVKELRLFLTRHRHVSRQKDRSWCSRGAKRWHPPMLVRRYELRIELDASSSAGHCYRMMEFLLLDTVARLLYNDGVTLDIAAWPLHKNDSQDLSWVVFFLNDTEVWLAQG